MMTTYSFTFVVGNVDPFGDDFEDRFFEAGCDDATLVLMHGAVAVCFDREHETFKEAVLSAYQNVSDTGSELLRFEPDYLVNASEIAARAGLSRAAVSLYENGERGEGFPKPFARITTKSPLWDWVEVSRWLCLRGKIDESEFRTAQISRAVNHSVQKCKGVVFARKMTNLALEAPLEIAV